MTAMFRDVVVEGTGTEAAIPGYTVAGKTGTREQGRERRATSRSTSRRSSASSPRGKPRLAILVMVDEPRGQIFGGVVAAPVFRDIARFALQYLEVPPDAPESKRSSLSARSVHRRPRRGGTAGHPSGSGGLAPYNRRDGARRADPRARAGGRDRAATRRDSRPRLRHTSGACGHAVLLRRGRDP